MSPLITGMNQSMRRTLVGSMLLLVVGIVSAQGLCDPAVAQTAVAREAASTEAILRTAIAAPHRSAVNRARDTYRHPLETLVFYGLRPDMTVVELWAGGGWYTEILAPVLAGPGKLVVVRPTKAFKDKMAADTKIYGKAEIVRVDPPGSLDLGPDSSADLVLTSRNVHNWVEGGYADKVYASAFKVLKPGGTLGLEEHRAKPGTDPQKSAKTGYMPEDAVIKAVEAAGFKFVAKSEVNANPKDTKDYEKGVWTLPPTLADGDKNRDKYLAIGESDRMTLKFVKPK